MHGGEGESRQPPKFIHAPSHHNTILEKRCGVAYRRLVPERLTCPGREHGFPNKVNGVHVVTILSKFVFVNS